VKEGLLTSAAAEEYLDTIRQDIQVLDRAKEKLFRLISPFFLALISFLFAVVHQCPLLMPCHSQD
jgi:hypothetical protein